MASLLCIGCHRQTPGVSLVIAATVALVMLHAMSGADAGLFYSITPPSEYRLLMGDLVINYTIPGNVSLPHAFISLAYVGKDGKEDAPMHRLRLRVGKTSGSLPVNCGHLVTAGKYKLKMHMYMKGAILAEATLDARWPHISLSLPDEHEAQTRNVELWILSHATCAPHTDRRYLQVKILRFRPDSARGNTTSITDGEVVGTRNYTSLTKIRTSIDWNCQIFDLDGSYQAVLVSTAHDDVIISSSNVMHVRWTGQYQLNLQRKSLFPCRDNASLVYTHPPCSGNDVIRLHSLHLKASGSLASPRERTYVLEKKADPAKTVMEFDCGLFSQDASGFCFTYVSVSKSEVYYEQTRFCIPARPNSVIPLDGAWSTWSEWSACTGKCGMGKKNRLRMCNNPAPKHGGRFCSGDPVEWRPCSHNCTETIPLNSLYSPPIDMTCQCGCIITDVKGDIIATGRCPGSAVWTLRADDGLVVSLTFGFFSLNYTRQKVTIRDGLSMYDQLLFSSNDHGYPMEVVSTGPILRVELYTEYEQPYPDEEFPIKAKTSIHSHGFVAHYQYQEPAKTSPVPVLYQYEEKTIMGSTVTIVGIVLCVVVVIVAVVFVILQRTFFHRKIKYTTTSIGGSPALAIPLTRSDTHLAKQQQHKRESRRHSYPHIDPAAVSISPHSSSNASSPGDAIYVDMEKPLTKKKNKGDNKSANRKPSKSSRTPSVSSACSQTVKFFKSSGGGNGPLSPKPTTKDYVTVKGPYGIEIVDTDEAHGPSKVKSPRSPHSYSRQRKSPSTPSSSATKMDILMKKRHDKKSDQSSSQMSELERVVTGSSDGSSSQKSKTSTTKAQVNWPQSGFVRAALNEVGKSFGDRNKRVNQRPPSEEIPLIDSNSQESPSHAINIMVKSDSSDSSASGLARLRSSKARRPTSLTESYSSDVQTPIKVKAIVVEPSPQISEKSDTGTLKKMDSVRPRPSPTPTSSLTPTSHLHNFPTLPPPSPASSRSPHPHRLQKQQQPQAQRQQTENPSPCLSRLTPSKPDSTAGNSRDKPKAGEKPNAEEREALLPKPDGQSPKPLRIETPDLKLQRLQRRTELSSPGKLSKCSSRGSKTTVSSPSRSINTPSETDGLELEYDDFIEDDPLSYFDYEETQKLAFRGVERIGKTPVEEDEDEMSQALNLK